MHFWSLSVEEQFYIVWPLLLLAAWRIVRRGPVATAAAVLGALWIASFAAALVLVGKNQPAAFFHTGPRCWQLATGGLLAALYLSGAEPGPRIRSAVLWLGLAAIAASVTLFDDTLFYPGGWALLPTLGAAAVILATDFSAASLPAGAILRARPLLWLGARSYSLYLWHWPVLVFLALAAPGGAGLGARLGGVALATALAAFMYAAVEDPIRRGRRLSAQPLASLAGAGAAISSIVIASALVAFAPIGAGSPTAELARRVEAARRDRPRVYADNCHVSFEAVEQPPCIYGAPGAPRRAVLLGDSHAAQWFPPLDAAAREAGWQLHAWTKSGCPAIEAPIWNKARRAHYEACDRWRASVMSALTGPGRPDLVFIANLTDYSGAIEDNVSGRRLLKGEADAQWREAFRATLRRLADAGVPVVVIRDTPQLSRRFADCLAAGWGERCGRPRAEALSGSGLDVEVAREFGASVGVLDLTDRICSGDFCPAERDGMIVYLDRHHLTATFAATLAEPFRELLAAHSGR